MKPGEMFGNKLRDFPYDPVRLACERCDRKGQYRKATLIERFGVLGRLHDLFILYRQLTAWKKRPNSSPI